MRAVGASALQRSRRSGHRRVAIVVLVLTMVSVGTGPFGAPASGAVGAGEARGTIIFDPPGVPPLLAPCDSVSFTFGSGSAATVAMTGFVGEVALEGSGEGFCENASSGSGNLTLRIPEAFGLAGGRFGCEELHGGYVRTASTLGLTVAGTCVLNWIPDLPVMMSIEGVFRPTGGSGTTQPGVTAPITTAGFGGGVALAPG